MYTAYVKDTLKLYIGIVDGDPVKENSGDAVKTVLVLRDFRGDKVKIAFKNGKHGAPRYEMLADRIINAGVKAGALLSVLAYCKDESKDVATGLNFKYQGLWTFKGDEKTKPVTVLIGRACNPRKGVSSTSGNPYFSIGVPVTEWRNGENVTRWINCVFMDKTVNGKKQNNAANAEKVLAGAERPIVIITGGTITSREYEGEKSESLVGYRILKAPAAKT
jgi:hypothetical protein